MSTPFYSVHCRLVNMPLLFGNVTNEVPYSGISEAVGTAVRRLREHRRWSVEQLAERCAAIGAGTLTVNALYVIESGRKEKATGRRRRLVDVDELLALACALEVHPVDLLVPGDAAADDRYDVTPGLSTTVGVARNWIGGQGFLSEPSDLHGLMEAIRWLPKERAAQLNRMWWTQEREAEQIRGFHAHRRATDPEGRGGFYGSDGKFYPAPVDPEAERRTSDPLGWFAERLEAKGNPDGTTENAPDGGRE